MPEFEFTDEEARELLPEMYVAPRPTRRRSLDERMRPYTWAQAAADLKNEE